MEQINALNIDNIQQQMDTTTPDWAKSIISQMGLLLKLAADIISDNNDNQSIQQQMEERDRQHCIVINNIPESNASQPINRAKEDEAVVEEILNACGLDTGLPVGIFRMGKKMVNKNRLIKVKFPCTASVKETLRGKKNLKTIPKFKNISIRESLSKEERDIRTSLIKKCIAMRAEKPGCDFIVYANNVILREEVHLFRNSLPKNL